MEKSKIDLLFTEYLDSEMYTISDLERDVKDLLTEYAQQLKNVPTDEELEKAHCYPQEYDSSDKIISAFCDGHELGFNDGAKYVITNLKNNKQD